MVDFAYSAGEEFIVPFPFVRCEVEAWVAGGDTSDLVKSWRPGVEWETGDSEYGGAAEAFAHAVGEMRLTVEAVFKPGRFPTRVFYTRQFTSPDGKMFGKGSLRIATVEKFRRLARGYALPYAIGEDDYSPPDPTPSIQDYHGFAGHAGTDSLPDDAGRPF